MFLKSILLIVGIWFAVVDCQQTNGCRCETTPPQRRTCRAGPDPGARACRDAGCCYDDRTIRVSFFYYAPKCFQSRVCSTLTCDVPTTQREGCGFLPFSCSRTNCCYDPASFRCYRPREIDAPTESTNQWAEWSNWGLCTSQCSPGTRSRARTCQSQGTNVGLDLCGTESTEVGSCNAHLCRLWGGWTNSTCSATCGATGAVVQRRQCARGRTNLDPVCTRRVVPCSGECGIAEWAEWSEWAECRTACSASRTYRYRQCNSNVGRTDLRNCVVNGYFVPVATITALAYENRPCNEFMCRSWAPWSAFTRCSCTPSNGNATESRSVRRCSVLGARVPGNEEERSQVLSCGVRNRACPTCPTIVTSTTTQETTTEPTTSQTRSQWTDWTRCSQSCSPGSRVRFQICANGAVCDRQSRRCNTEMCTTWSRWSATACLVHCGSQGKKISERRISRTCLGKRGRTEPPRCFSATIPCQSDTNCTSQSTNVPDTTYVDVTMETNSSTMATNSSTMATNSSTMETTPSTMATTPTTMATNSSTMATNPTTMATTPTTMATTLSTMATTPTTMATTPTTMATTLSTMATTPSTMATTLSTMATTPSTMATTPTTMATTPTTMATNSSTMATTPTTMATTLSTMATTPSTMATTPTTMATTSSTMATTPTTMATTLSTIATTPTTMATTPTTIATTSTTMATTPTTMATTPTTIATDSVISEADTLIASNPGSTPGPDATIYGRWGGWSGCSADCRPGIQSRSRPCIVTSQCDGADTETRACNEDVCQNWSAWVGEGCDCGGRIQTMRRDCLNDQSAPAECLIQTVPCSDVQPCDDDVNLMFLVDSSNYVDDCRALSRGGLVVPVTSQIQNSQTTPNYLRVKDFIAEFATGWRSVSDSRSHVGIQLYSEICSPSSGRNFHLLKNLSQPHNDFVATYVDPLPYLCGMFWLDLALQCSMKNFEQPRVGGRRDVIVVFMSYTPSYTRPSSFVLNSLYNKARASDVTILVAGITPQDDMSEKRRGIYERVMTSVACGDNGDCSSYIGDIWDQSRGSPAERIRNALNQ